jgi:hypothetical protein
MFTGDLQNLHQRVIEAFGDGALETIAGVVAWAHVSTPTIGGQLYGQVGRERAGLFRWMQIDAHLLGLYGKLEKVRFEWQPNRVNGGKHLEAIANDVRILIAHDHDPRTYVPVSDYATSLVESNQGMLFQLPDKAGPITVADNSQARYYTVVLFHSKNEVKGQVPCTLEIRFPDGQGGYAADHMNLSLKYPNTTNIAWLQAASNQWVAEPVAGEEKVADAAVPAVRREKQSGT